MSKVYTKQLNKNISLTDRRETSKMNYIVNIEDTIWAVTSDTVS